MDIVRIKVATEKNLAVYLILLEHRDWRIVHTRCMILNFGTNTGIDYQENSTEVYRHQRNINVFVVVIITGNNNIQVTAVWWNLHLCHVPRQIYYFLVHTFFVPGEHAVKEQAAST